MSKCLEKFKLLSLLGSNQDKIDCIKEANSSDELWSLYEYLSVDNDDRDLSFVSHGQVKREILQQEKMNYIDLWKVFNKENSDELRTKSFNLYLNSHPHILSPSFYRNFSNNKHYAKNLIYLCTFYSSIVLFIISIIVGLFTKSLLIPIASFFLINYLWKLTGGYNSTKFQDLVMQIVVIITCPIWLALGCLFISLFFSGFFWEHSLKNKFPRF